jgi:hypothetical protein
LQAGAEPSDRERKKIKKERKQKVLHFYRSQDRDEKRQGAMRCCAIE